MPALAALWTEFETRHRRWVGFVPALSALLASIAIFLRRSWNPGLLADTDTVALLRAIRERQDPLSWFYGDWPLFNHFYRPVSTLFFEFDNWRYGSDAAGYGLTNALIAMACVWLLFWFVRELTDRPWLAAGSAGLFAWWTSGIPLPGMNLIHYAPYLLAIAVVARRRALSWEPVVVLLVGLFTVEQFWGIAPLEFRIVDWLPGRTASVMTLFTLIAMAAYSRAERMRSLERRSWPWGVLMVLATALALGSYEQAVMLPGALVGIAVFLRLEGKRPAWAWPAVAWAILGGYLVLRYQIVPTEASGYQQQQFRSGPGVWLDLGEYLFPASSSFTMFVSAVTMGLAAIILGSFWQPIVSLATTLVGFARSWASPRRNLILAGYALSAIAYLPMAWLKLFEHYHFWPMALRSLMVCGLILLLADLVREAWKREPSGA